MANTKEKLQILKTLHSQQQTIYAEKNEKYDDAFAKTYAEYGPTVAIIRLEDKLNRVKALVSAGLNDSNGESLADTLIDMANYANMFLIELGAEVSPVGEKPKKKRNRKNQGETEAADKGPLDDLTKKQLIEAISQLGGTVPKKANREKLTEVIAGFPKAEVAVVITSLKAQGSTSWGEKSDEEEEE